MGMDAYVIAFGRYQESIKEHLDYPAEFYDDVKLGTPIVTTLFWCYTSNTSRNLATALGCVPWDFNTHRLDVSGIRPDDLLTYDGLEGMDNLERSVENFKVLRDAGFKFHYMPNG